VIDIIGFVITAMAPLLFSLHLPEIIRELGILPSLANFAGSAAALIVAATVLGVGNVVVGRLIAGLPGALLAVPTLAPLRSLVDPFRPRFQRES
jgi:hypothetical protein